MQYSSLQTAIPQPTLEESERPVATIITPNRRCEHIIRMALMPADGMTWQTAMNFAKDAGGELPSHVESALLFETKEEGEFKPDWYWTREQHPGLGSCACCQDFSNGGQYFVREGHKCLVVLVRRVAI